MRLVITWYYSSEECSEAVVVPLEYESAEAFYVDFEEAVTSRQKEFAKWQKEKRVHRESLQPLFVGLKKCKPGTQAYREKMAEYKEQLKKATPMPSGNIYFAGKNWPVEEFWKRKYITGMTKRDREKGRCPEPVDKIGHFSPPEIQTLEEWFVEGSQPEEKT